MEEMIPFLVCFEACYCKILEMLVNPANVCSNSIIKTVEKGVKHVQS